MEQKTDAVLIVEKGDPDELGKVIFLSTHPMIMGRSYEGHEPDISFKNLFISKNHAQITYSNGRFILIDLTTSKHGTELNGMPMIKGMPYVLKHNDEIRLAKKSVQLRFCFESELGKTLDFPDVEDRAVKESSNNSAITVDEKRKEVLIRGKELRPRLSKQEFELLLLLFNNRNRAISKDKIRDWVWHEIEFPDGVTDEAIHSLVHRLKKSLKEHGKQIVAVYGCYRFDDKANE